MVNLLFQPDSDALTNKGIVKTLLNPACGTRGMLAVAGECSVRIRPSIHRELGLPRQQCHAVADASQFQ